jgi:hypothetical protein
MAEYLKFKKRQKDTKLKRCEYLHGDQKIKSSGKAFSAELRS